MIRLVRSPCRHFEVSSGHQSVVHVHVCNIDLYKDTTACTHVCKKATQPFVFCEHRAFIELPTAAGPHSLTTLFNWNARISSCTAFTALSLRHVATQLLPYNGSLSGPHFVILSLRAQGLNRKTHSGHKHGKKCNVAAWYPFRTVWTKTLAGTASRNWSRKLRHRSLRSQHAADQNHKRPSWTPKISQGPSTKSLWSLVS